MAMTSQQHYTATSFITIFMVLCAGSVALTKDADYSKLDIKDNDVKQSMNPRQYQGNAGFGGFGSSGSGGCPLCDASVYSYCSHKVIHDSCCCDFPVAQLKPPQCYYYDCALLYAKTCYEHSLIRNCCCNSPY